MDNNYEPGKIEPKWQSNWADAGVHATKKNSGKPKFFAMEMFPYPSGAGLHAGHLKNYVPTDAFCRYKAMKGYNVLYPIGWDAFGQPAENEAIKRGRNPSEMVREYSGNFRRAMQRLGLSYDWSREINTSDPEYYRWTQWFFLLLYKRKLAYRSNAPINWCPSCATGLANEEVKEGRCWRCDTPIEKRDMPQWYFRITQYADRLSKDLDDLNWPEGIKAMQRDWIGCNDDGKPKMRDWLISRQRYWGAPIPIVHCSKCGEVPVPEDQLPVKLPEVASYKPSGTGESPLATIPEFVNCQCPTCGGDARRETDTMGGFACSSWYFLRYADPQNKSAFADREAVDYWAPVDLYTGGAEHAVMHLLYSRFWTKVMYDAGLIGFQEPFLQLRNQGTVLANTPGRRPRHEEAVAGDDGNVVDWIVLKPEERDSGKIPVDQIVWRWVKMSKSKGNGVDPGEIIEKYGADTVRMYMMFVAPFEDDVRWSDEGLVGAQRFMNRLWRWSTNAIGAYDADWAQKLGSQHFTDAERNVRRKLHQTVAKVGAALEAFSFNTAIAALHELVNELNVWMPADADATSGFNRVVISEVLDKMVRIISPFVPHAADELWSRMGHADCLYGSSWPEFDAAVARENEITLVVQINGKVRDRITVAADSTNEVLEQHARASAFVQEQVSAGKSIAKVIVVPKKLVNIVIK